MSNLCQEITLPTTPLDHIDDEKGEIALCILSAVNLGLIRDKDELEGLCDLSVRALDEIIDYQEYPIEAARTSARVKALTRYWLYWSCSLSCKESCEV